MYIVGKLLLYLFDMYVYVMINNYLAPSCGALELCIVCCYVNLTAVESLSVQCRVLFI